MRRPRASSSWRSATLSQAKDEVVAAGAGGRRHDRLSHGARRARVDGVALLLPHALHHPVGLGRPSRARKHVCIKKPITVTGAQAQGLIRHGRHGRCDTGGSREHPVRPRLCRSGTDGPQRPTRRDPFRPRLHPRPDHRRVGPGRSDAGVEAGAHGCGALQDCGPHMFDLLIWYFGGSMAASGRRPGLGARGGPRQPHRRSRPDGRRADVQCRVRRRP